MNPIFAIITLLGLLSLANSQAIAGGFSRHKVTQALESSSVKFVERLSNYELNTWMKDSQLRLVYFATQVVAGTNRAIVFKNSTNKYRCLVIYENLQGELLLFKDAEGFTLPDTLRGCNVPFLN